MLFIADFNFQHDCDHKMSLMRGVFTQFDLEQCVRDPTHKSCYVLDWVLQRQCDPLLQSVSVQSVFTSDHMSIVCTMNISKPKCPPTVMFRRWLKAIDTDGFHADLSHILTKHPDMTVIELKALLASPLDKHVPVTRHIQKRKKIMPWFTREIFVAKRERGRAERAWRRHGQTVHKDIFTLKKRCSDTLSP